MHFSYVKSNILRRWLNILRNYVHTRTFFTPKIHPPPITRPATRSGPPPDPARHPTRPATRPGPPPHPARHPTRPATHPPSHPARHPTQPATPPSLPPHPASDPTHVAHSARATTASRSLRRAGAVLVVLRRLYVWGEGHLIIYIPFLITYVPYPIFYIPIFYIPYLIFYVPYLIFYIPYPIFDVTFTCDAATVDTLLACPLPQGVVNCPHVTQAFPCTVELGASQVSVHSSAPEMLCVNRRLKLQTLVDV